MKKIIKILVCAVSALCVLCSVALFGGCADGKIELTVTGSTSVRPLMMKLAAEYEQNHDVVINISEGGSTAGIQDALSGRNDFGMSSREITADEMSKGVKSQKIATDGIALIVNKNCTVTSVNKEEVFALYSGGTAIQEKIFAAISRSSGSGTRDAFNEIMGIKELHKGTGFTEKDKTNEVLTDIYGNSAGNTVAYISLGSLNDSVKALVFEGVEATQEKVSSGAYTLARPFNIVYKEENLSEETKAFIEFILSAEGQAIVTANGYVAV